METAALTNAGWSSASLAKEATLLGTTPVMRPAETAGTSTSKAVMTATPEQETAVTTPLVMSLEASTVPTSTSNPEDSRQPKEPGGASTNAMKSAETASTSNSTTVTTATSSTATAVT